MSWSAVGGAAAVRRLPQLRRLSRRTAGSSSPSGVAGTTCSTRPSPAGRTYSYVVTAASDPQGFCESAASPCKSVVPTGDCFLAPSFARRALRRERRDERVRRDGRWDPASPYCGSDVRYNVYRSASSGFTPGPANRIARCVARHLLDDAASPRGRDDLLLRRARRGRERPDTAARAATATRTRTSRRPPPRPFGPAGFGTFADDAGDTGSRPARGSSPWTLAPTGGNAGPQVYTAASSAGVCADLQTPVAHAGRSGTGPAALLRHEAQPRLRPQRQDLRRRGIARAGRDRDRSVVHRTGRGSPSRRATRTSSSSRSTTVRRRSGIDLYFTGTRPTYGAYSASLANWAGGDVKLRFHLSGDFLYDTGKLVDRRRLGDARARPSACAAASAGPPPIPDGAAVPGVPMRAAKSGSQVVVTWDATPLPGRRGQRLSRRARQLRRLHRRELQPAADGLRDARDAGQRLVPRRGDGRQPHRRQLGSHARRRRARLCGRRPPRARRSPQHVTTNGCP